MNELEKEYTLSEAAERLAELRNKPKPYTRQYMYKLYKEGKLKCRKVGQEGNMYVTTESALLELISNIQRVGRPKKNS